MKRSRVAVAAVLLVTGGVVAEGADAQWQRTDVGWCDDDRRGRDTDRFCLAFEASFDDPGALSIDGGLNGGVAVEGWERDVVGVRAEVWANARTPERAEELAAQVEVRFVDGRLVAEGPRTDRRESWGVGWEVRVPFETDLDIETTNGGIDVTEVLGRVRFRALNGGVHLTDIGGDVRGSTTNGGLHVELSGAEWEGEGLDVETTNGGVTLRVPEGYSARLETGTVNGGIELDFPITVQGRLGRQLTTTLGDGGPTIRATTTNGGVKIQRGSSAVRLR